jgi:predicted chitinase
MFFTDLSENEPSSDLGIHYGRGFIQLTHKGAEDSRTKNADSYLGYKKYSKLDVVTTPDLICKSLESSADSGGWFWRYGKLLKDGSIKDLNTLADNDDANEISRLVNGGENARKERLEANKQFKKIFVYDEECINKK